MPDGQNLQFKSLMRAVAAELGGWGGAFTTSDGGAAGEYVSKALADYGYSRFQQLEKHWVFDLHSRKAHLISNYEGPPGCTATVIHGNDLDIPPNRDFWIFDEDPKQYADAARSAIRAESTLSLALPSYREYVLPPNLTESEYETARDNDETPRPEDTLNIPELTEIDYIELTDLGTGLSGTESVYVYGQLLPARLWTWDRRRRLLQWDGWLAGSRVRIYGRFTNEGITANWDAENETLNLSEMVLRDIGDRDRTRLIFASCSLWATMKMRAASPDNFNKFQRLSRHYRNRIENEVDAVADAVVER